jgi:F-type H+-transporting ATPase subunit b
MQIDWFTLLAEIVNFLILVYLLRRFLYNPIIRLADEREARIAARFAEAEAREQEAAAAAAAHEQQRRELDARRQDLLDEARRAAQEERHALLERARAEVGDEQRRWQQQLARQRQTFLHDLQERTGAEVYALSARVLTDLASANLQEQIVGRFLAELRQLPAAETEAFQEHLGDGGLEVVTAFPLSAEQRDDISAALAERLGARDLPVAFHEDEALIGGIALRLGGRQLGWTVRTYLDRLQERMEEALQEALAGVDEPVDEQEPAAEEARG